MVPALLDSAEVLMAGTFVKGRGHVESQEEPEGGKGSSLLFSDIPLMKTGEFHGNYLNISKEPRTSHWALPLKKDHPPALLC